MLHLHRITGHVTNTLPILPISNNPMKNPYILLLRTAWKFARQERKKFLLIYFLFFCAHIIALMHPLLFGWFVGKIQSDDSKTVSYAYLFVGCYFALKLGEWCLHGPARILERTLAFNIGRNFLRERYHQVLHLDARWHQDHHSGATIDRVQKAYHGLRNFYNNGFMYFYTLIRLVFSVGAILYFSPFFGSIAVVLGCINIYVISRFDKTFIKTLKEVNEREGAVSANLFDSLSNIRTVITLRLEGSMERGLMGRVRQLFRPFRKNAVLNEWKWFSADMFITLIYCVVVLGYVYQNWQPGAVFYVAGLVTLIGYVNQFTNVFQNVAGQYTTIMQYNTYVQAAGEIDQAYQALHRAGGTEVIPCNWQTMKLYNLSFSHCAVYNEQHAPQSLHRLNLTIRRGKKIALIGASGSGKSTLLSLLRGLYVPEDGVDFQVDGKRCSLDALHETVTLFPQEPEIFENTIAYNVTLGLPFEDADIMQVCNGAHFSEVVHQMPHGLKTDIREKGVNLSGGQKQRLALARGILASADSHLVLLDEPTSSVDPRTELQIYKNLFELFSDKAIISSIHRLHLLPQFDYIYVLEQGKIIGEGTFEELLTGNAAFRALWEHQRAASVDTYN